MKYAINFIILITINQNYKKDNTLDSYEALDIEDLSEVYCNDDWYVINSANEYIETFNNSSDERANNEINSISLKYEKVLKRLIQ